MSSLPRRSSRHNKKRENENILTQPPLLPPPQQPTTARMQCPASFDGIITHFNISPHLIRELSKRVPLLGSSHCSVRRIIRNNPSLHASTPLVKAIVAEMVAHLKSSCKTKRHIKSSESGEWILAPKSTRCKAQRAGPHHRDTTRKPAGYMTALIFLGNRMDSDYGDVTLYRGSQEIKPDRHTFTSNDKKFLERRVENGTVSKELVKREEFNCSIIDSRLVHFSHVHTQHEQRTVFSIQLYRNGLAKLKQHKNPKLKDITVGEIFYYE